MLFDTAVSSFVDWFSFFLTVPIIFGYPIGGPAACEKCGKEIPGTDTFWDFRFIPYCKECEKSLTEDERAKFEGRKHQYRNILRGVLRLNGKEVAYDDVEREARTDFITAIVGSRKHKSGT